MRRAYKYIKIFLVCYLISFLIIQICFFLVSTPKKSAVLSLVFSAIVTGASVIEGNKIFQRTKNMVPSGFLDTIEAYMFIDKWHYSVFGRFYFYNDKTLFCSNSIIPINYDNVQSVECKRNVGKLIINFKDDTPSLRFASSNNRRICSFIMRHK